MSAVVVLDHVGMDYGAARVLDDVTFTIEAGDFVGIIGPNGSGKTTLLRLMVGLLAPTAGRIRLFGVDPIGFRDWRKIGYVPQRTLLDAALPVRVDEVVMTGLVATRSMFRGGGADARRRVTDALAFVGMADRAATRVGALSAGQQQRVLIARARVQSGAAHPRRADGRRRSGDAGELLRAAAGPQSSAR